MKNLPQQLVCSKPLRRCSEVVRRCSQDWYWRRFEWHHLCAELLWASSMTRMTRNVATLPALRCCQAADGPASSAFHLSWDLKGRLHPMVFPMLPGGSFSSCPVTWHCLQLGKNWKNMEEWGKHLILRRTLSKWLRWWFHGWDCVLGRKDCRRRTRSGLHWPYLQPRQSWDEPCGRPTRSLSECPRRSGCIKPPQVWKLRQKICSYKAQLRKMWLWIPEKRSAESFQGKEAKLGSWQCHSQCLAMQLSRWIHLGLVLMFLRPSQGTFWKACFVLASPISSLIEIRTCFKYIWWRRKGLWSFLGLGACQSPRSPREWYNATWYKTVVAMIENLKSQGQTCTQQYVILCKVQSFTTYSDRVYYSVSAEALA